MSAKHPIHFVGSIGLDDAETVFRNLSETVGERAFYYPDGETGVRTNWVGWQAQVFEEHPGFEFDGDRGALTQGAGQSPQYKPMVGAKDLSFPPVGYAKEALSSYSTFADLKAKGEIPGSIRFQVSLPTPTAVVALFVSPEHRSAVHDAYVDAMQNELADILEAIPHDQLALQWDIAMEVIAYDGGPPIHLPKPLEDTVALISQLSNDIPVTVHLGYHLCYGDPGHKHVVEPEDLATSVRFANALCKTVQRRSDFVHMAVPRERNDFAYFAPLTGLDIGDTRLVLGLVHHTDGVDGTRQRMQMAQKQIAEFSIATECGFGRREPATIPELLGIHAKVADGQ